MNTGEGQSQLLRCEYDKFWLAMLAYFRPRMRA